MKKITFILTLLMASYGFAQNVSTGVITLNSSAGFTVQFDVNGTTNMVTMTMVGPSNRWLGVALNTAANNSMGSGGEDAIIYHGSTGTLSDRNLTGATNTPNTDASQDWSLDSNTTNGSVRTIVATRARDTGDANDYVFPTTNNTAFPMLWAMGSSLTLSQHNNRGGAASTLGTGAIPTLPEFNVYPNPTLKELNVEFPASIQKASVAVYSVLGTLVLQTELDPFNSKINTSEWNTGVYIMNISTPNFSQTKRIIKQ
ncbi:T9SS type A sorting domain-containing protein [Flavobacteriaceae bacterium]|nr:T9SS type A sorting domain-containing protein [Flavobacteriaceae bacterium]